MSKEEKKQLLTRTSYQEHKKKQKFIRKEKIVKKNKKDRLEHTEEKEAPNQGERLTKKEQGRQLDHFYNWAIALVLTAIILVFVLAFVI